MQSNTFTEQYWRKLYWIFYVLSETKVCRSEIVTIEILFIVIYEKLEIEIQLIWIQNYVARSYFFWVPDSTH